jgi:hypothetical protein
LAGFRGELTEVGLVQAIRDIYNFFYDKTGETSAAGFDSWATCSNVVVV